MSEVPFLDSSCLGPDLTSFNEDDLLRYFLNDDFEQVSPFDSKVPSPLLDPPTITQVTPPPPKQVMAPHTSLPVQVKKEPQQPIVNTKTNNNNKGKTNIPSSSNNKLVTSLPVVKSPVHNNHIITPVSLPHSLPSTKPSLLPTNKYCPSPLPPKPGVPVIPAQQIHPITAVSVTPVSSSSPAVPSLQDTKNAILTPLSSPSTSPLSSPSVSPAPSPSVSPSVPVVEDEKTQKRQRRLLKNRESAQLSRIRKKMYIDELERKVNALVSENTGLKDEVVHLNNVLKQVTNGKESEFSKSALGKSELMNSIAAGSSANHHQAKKYAGVCLLVVLFSLGLFLNVANTQNPARVQTERLLELDNHHSKNNGTSSANTSNDHVQYRDFKLVKTTDPEAVSFTTEKSEKQGKRAWESTEDEYDIFPSSHKRTRTDYSVDSPMIIEKEDEDLFDVLEDDAFSDDGILTTSSSASSSALSSPSSSAPASPVPSSPLFPGQVTPTPSTPIMQPPSPIASSLSPSSLIGQQVGVSVMVPAPDDPVRLVHIHLWSLLQ